MKGNGFDRATRINLVFLAAALVLSLHAVPYELRVCVPPPDRGDASPQALAAGVAATPYQYRVLVPLLVRSAMELRLLRPEAQLVAFAAAQTIALVLLAFVFRRFLTLFVHDHTLASIMALSVYAILPFNYFNQPYQPSDIPAVMFFTLGLLLIRAEKWMPFFPVFALATLNRETSIFLAVVSVVLLFDKYKWQRLATIVASQVLVWTAIKGTLWMIYWRNRSLGYGLYEFQLKVNAATLLAFPVRGTIVLTTWAAVWIAALLWYRRIDDEFLKRLLLTVPVFVAAMLVVGFVLELRIYGEVLPIVLAAFWVIFLDLVRQSMSSGVLTQNPFHGIRHEVADRKA